jgi:hypothetical protein
MNNSILFDVHTNYLAEVNKKNQDILMEQFKRTEQKKQKELKDLLEQEEQKQKQMMELESIQIKKEPMNP